MKTAANETGSSDHELGTAWFTENTGTSARIRVKLDAFKNCLHLDSLDVLRFASDFSAQIPPIVICATRLSVEKYEVLSELGDLNIQMTDATVTPTRIANKRPREMARKTTSGNTR